MWLFWSVANFILFLFFPTLMLQFHLLLKCCICAWNTVMVNLLMFNVPAVRSRCLRIQVIQTCQRSADNEFTVPFEAGVQISLQCGWVRVVILIQLDSRWLAVFFFTQARHCLLLLVVRPNVADHENFQNFTKSTHLKVECLLFYVCFGQQVTEVLHASCRWKSYHCNIYQRHHFCLQKTLYLNKMVNNFLFFALLLLFRQNSVHSAFVE